MISMKNLIQPNHFFHIDIESMKNKLYDLIEKIKA